jgi:hypothetical protein
MASKLQKALTNIQGELEKLDPRSRAAIEKQLKIVQTELRKLLAGVIGYDVGGPVWALERPSRRGRSKKS